MRAVPKYKPIQCADCGAEVHPTSGNFKRCKPCQMKSRGQTGCGYLEKTCERCRVTYKPNATGQKFCATCRPIARKEYNLTKLAALRLQAGQTPLGTLCTCADCGRPYPLRKGGPQSRCIGCQREVNRLRAIETNKAHPLRAMWHKKAKETMAFGGNKRAVLARDGHACRKCGTTEKLCVHHIDGMGKGVPREAQNHSMDNLITLCLTCHSGVHAMMERLFYLRHPDTVREALDMFLEAPHSSCAPQR